MDRVADIAPAGRWPAAEQRDAITLAYHDRHRRRLHLRAAGGTSFVLDLPQAVLLRDGDGLMLESGGYVLVRAAAEPLLEARARSPRELARLAWHLGNRHLLAEIGADRILIQRDHVIAEMLRRLGAEVRDVMAPFNPETGAYAGPGPHVHGHDGDHAHAHHGDHRHSHGHEPGAAERHAEASRDRSASLDRRGAAATPPRGRPPGA